MLNRFLAAQRSGFGRRSQKEKAEKPVLEEVSNLSEAEKWRHECVRTLTKKITQIQNGNLGEPLIRDLNEEINKLLKEKRAWEQQILVLGGPNYSASEVSVADIDGKTIQIEGSNYFYFGAARNLPGVREVLEKQWRRQTRRSKVEIQQNIDSTYYGFHEDDDEELRVAEQDLEAEFLPLVENENDVDEIRVPSKQEIEAALLEKKKKDLMTRFELGK